MTLQEITPANSVCPVFISPLSEEQLEADRLEREQMMAEKEAKATQRQAILDRLGLTAEEAALLLGGN